MPVITDHKRKNAFSQRLKDKRQKPVVEAEMTDQEMQVCRKMQTVAKTALGNLFGAIKEPSQAQIRELACLLDELSEAIRENRQFLA